MSVWSKRFGSLPPAAFDSPFQKMHTRVAERKAAAAASKAAATLMHDSPYKATVAGLVETAVVAALKAYGTALNRPIPRATMATALSEVPPLLPHTSHTCFH